MKIKVRVPMSVGGAGAWCVVGWGGSVGGVPSHEDSDETIYCADEDVAFRCWIEAEVDVPEPGVPVIVGKVSAAGEAESGAE
jgi:hypothetical protein